MSAAPIPREQVIALLDELPPERRPDVVRFLRSLLAENDERRAKAAVEVAGTAQDEARLVEIAKRALPPDVAARLRDLRAREAAGRLSDGDRAELHALEGRADRIDTERTAALLSLAHMRGVEVMDVVLALGLSSEGGRH